MVYMTNLIKLTITIIFKNTKKKKSLFLKLKQTDPLLGTFSWLFINVDVESI
jgi:hypothetical protein